MQILLMFEQAIEALVSLTDSMGYLGIFILMALESSVVPVPSELVLIPAGILAFQGQMSFTMIILFALLGSIAGSLISYAIALHLGRKATERLISKYGRFLFIDSKKLQAADKFFEKHGPITIFTARLIPVIRHLISLPAGFARMNLFKFTLYTSLGAGFWAIILTLFGVLFGTLALAHKLIVTLAFLILCLIIIIIYIAKHKNN
jgi:membrane protein DedA with SNARE-associated domain